MNGDNNKLKLVTNKYEREKTYVNEWVTGHEDEALLF